MKDENKFPVKTGKRFFAFILLGVFGVVFLIYGIVSTHRFEKAVSFEQLTEKNCQAGQYVSGEITSYVYMDMGKGNINGVSEEFINGGVTSYTYTAYIANGKMIRIITDNWEKRRELDNILSTDDPIKFEGKIEKASTNLNITWYNSVGVENTEDIIEAYVVKEADIRSGNKFVLGGLGCIVVSTICLMVYCRFCRNGLLYR